MITWSFWQSVFHHSQIWCLTYDKSTRYSKNNPVPKLYSLQRTERRKTLGTLLKKVWILPWPQQTSQPPRLSPRLNQQSDSSTRNEQTQISTVTSFISVLISLYNVKRKIYICIVILHWMRLSFKSRHSLLNTLDGICGMLLDVFWGGIPMSVNSRGVYKWTRVYNVVITSSAFK